MRFRNRLERGVAARRLAQQHLVHHAAKAVDVGAAIERQPQRLLGTHIARGPEHESGLRERRTGLGATSLRDPEIRDPGMPPRQENVLRLDVAMHDAGVVRVVQGVGRFAGDRQGVEQREGCLPAQPLAEGLAFDAWHDVIEDAGGFSGIE